MKVTDIPANYNQQKMVKETAEIKEGNLKADRSSDAARKTANEGVIVKLSKTSKELQTAIDAANKAPDVRNEKVAQLKSEVQEGRYRIDADKIAAKILDKDS
ncbi:MAG: flagellar biosynthesis anti-sigma factor FlgM [Desulfobacterales bacterium]|nr:flagellar biosynthesis anti-sigma factor FlgM [Desulfobacterales bacterium]MDJ0912147.1 flagellar biosynthesis anti-sigma factor FlgM [Desulfobacterales bacterium]